MVVTRPRDSWKMERRTAAVVDAFASPTPTPRGRMSDPCCAQLLVNVMYLPILLVKKAGRRWSLRRLATSPYPISKLVENHWLSTYIDLVPISHSRSAQIRYVGSSAGG